jgi:hypothetical protein
MAKLIIFDSSPGSVVVVDVVPESLTEDLELSEFAEVVVVAGWFSVGTGVSVGVVVVSACGFGL